MLPWLLIIEVAKPATNANKAYANGYGYTTFTRSPKLKMRPLGSYGGG